MGKVTITLPPITAEWIPVNPDEASVAIRSWDLNLTGTLSHAASLFYGTSTRLEGRLIAWIDEHKDGQFRAIVSGLVGGIDSSAIDESFPTFEEAEARIHDALCAKEESCGTSE